MVALPQLANEPSIIIQHARRVAAEFVKELKLGLRQRTPTVCQIPTYVTRVATGTEKGISPAVDLGGTNLRVCSVLLHGDTSWTVRQSQMPIPREVMTAKEPRELFSHIAVRIRDFLQDLEPPFKDAVQSGTGDRLPLGFTFSFPAYQTGVNSGVLLYWTKGFDIPAVVGQDVCKLLQSEIDLLGLPVKVTALVNDAAGTVVSRSYALPLGDLRPSVGAIFGTGTNGVYFQKLSEITKPLGEDYSTSSIGEMLISTEWGSLDSTLLVLPVTSYDAELDRHSLNPGGQTFEKRVSGMFLGELLRLAILAMYSDENISFFRQNDVVTMDPNIPLQTRWAVDSSILSIAETDTTLDLRSLQKKMQTTFGVPETHITIEEAMAVKHIARAIGTRAARLAGTALGSVIVQGNLLDLSQPEVASVDVAVDGSVVEHYPGFVSGIRQALRVIPGIGEDGEKNFIRIGHAKDGSSVGAAIIALLAAADHPKLEVA